MDARFIPIEIVPSKTPFGLDQLRRSYKTALSAEDAMAAAPAVGDPDDVFRNMFLMPISTPESAESATRIDLLYMGSLSGDEGSPILPAARHDNDTAVQSASSSRANDGRIASSPLTLQYFAPTTNLSYISFGAPGTDQADDPTDGLTIITLTLGDVTLAVGTASLQALVDAFFTPQIIETHQATEIVPGQYWQNVSKKAKNYQPFIYDFAPGPYLVLAAPGQDYTLGDVLTVSGGAGSASITITQLGISDSVTGWSLDSITCTISQSNVPASGGTGFGARFNIVIVT